MIDQNIYKILENTTDFISNWYIKQSLSKHYEGDKIVNYNNMLAYIMNNSFIIINIDKNSDFIENIIQSAILSLHIEYLYDECPDITDDSEIDICDVEEIDNINLDLTFQYPDDFKEMFINKIFNRVNELKKIDEIITIDNYKNYYDNDYPFAIFSKKENDSIITKYVYNAETMEKIQNENDILINIMAKIDHEIFESMLDSKQINQLVKKYISEENSNITIIPSIIRKEIFKELYSIKQINNCAYFISFDDINNCRLKSIIKILIDYGMASDEAKEIYNKK